MPAEIMLNLSLSAKYSSFISLKICWAQANSECICVWSSVLKRAPLATGKQVAALLWGEAELGLLLCNVYLQQACYSAAGFFALAVYLAQQLVAIDAVD